MTIQDIHYPEIIDQAMRSVVKTVMKRVQTTGLPGEHHFYISFLTHFPGVRISEQLRARYPRDITIVMQHQYWDFKVDDQGFTVTLSFGGVPEKLSVPFAALTAFADPSVKFGLQFQPADMDEEEEEEQETVSGPLPGAGPATEKPLAASAATDDEDADPGAAEIISLDSFRKK